MEEALELAEEKADVEGEDEAVPSAYIKFVTRYCKGHGFLAAKVFASKLYAFERLPGGLYKDWFDVDQKG